MALEVSPVPSREDEQPDYWREADRTATCHPELDDQEEFWRAFLAAARGAAFPVSCGHPLFRLACIALDRGQLPEALTLLNDAYGQDERFCDYREVPQDMAAYRLRAILVGVERAVGAGADSIYGPYCDAAGLASLIRVVKLVFDASLPSVFDQGRLYSHVFQRHLAPGPLLLFAVESYYAACRILELDELESCPFGPNDVYPMGRATCVLLGSAVEAVLVGVTGQEGTLGGSIRLARERGRLQPHTVSDAAFVLINYFRNRVHPRIDAHDGHPIDLNIARVMKAAFDRALAELPVA